MQNLDSKQQNLRIRLMANAFCCTISVLISDHDEIYELRMKHVFLSLFPQKIFQQKFCHKPWGRGPCNILSRFVQTGGTETFPFFMSTLSTSGKKWIFEKPQHICAFVCVQLDETTHLSNTCFSRYAVFNALKTHFFGPCIKHGGTTLHVNMLAASLRR